ncbi:MAG TPA: RHS repeat-associated core domain-containing protein [Burkholderiales bacterium]|nr:RHS repeat-associated core domain-containing protein [Burkholderiales bacterium]
MWLNDTPVALITTGATPSFYFVHSDQLDTPRVITDRNQQIRWRWDNDDPFGGNMANQNPSGLGTFAFNLRYPGQYFDAETNQHYNYYRDYSPDIGRYIESDPIGLAGGINTYVYGDDPLTEIDPLGLKGIAFSSSSTPPPAPPTAAVSSCGQQCNCPDYGIRYSQHLNQYLVNVGPYASALAVGPWPKSWAPATGGRPPLLGSSNPLTSVPRAFGVPGAASTVARGSAAAVGVATVGIGFYNIGTFASGLFYAIPSYCSCTGGTQP